MKKMYMELDKDGLPIRTAYSAGELARLAGVKENNINCAISHYNKNHRHKDENATARGRKRRWVVIDLDEED